MGLQKSLLALTLGLLTLSCGATSRRIRANEDLFESYSPEDQATIRSGRISHGFDGTQVYLAFGNADRTEMDGEVELWFYHHTFKRVVREEKSASEYRSEMDAYELAVREGEEGLVEPETYRDVHLRREGVVRIVRFENGQVVGWEEPREHWLEDWHP